MSYSYTKNPKRLREEARSFASDKKGPREVWSALKSWASDRGPVAVKAAVFEFLERYGTRPEAVPVFPEVLQQASEISPSLKGKERKHLVELADCASLTAKGGLALQPAINPKTDRLLNMPVSGSRPDPSLFFRPAETPKLPQLGNVGPLVPSSDINQLIKARDAMLHVNEKPYELPTPAKTPYKKKEHKQPPEIMSFSMPLDSSKRSLKAGKKGEKLILSLIEKMKEHAKEEHKTASPPRVERAEKTPEKAKPKRKRPKKAKTPKKEEIVKKAKPKPKRKKAKKRKAPKKVAPKKEEAPKKIKTKLRPRPKSKPKKKKPRKIKARPKKKRPKPKKKAIKKAKPKPRPKKKIVKRRAAKKKPKKTKAKPKPKTKPPKKKPAKKKAKKSKKKKSKKK